jgi:hypothetical protein
MKSNLKSEVKYYPGNQRNLLLFFRRMRTPPVCSSRKRMLSPYSNQKLSSSHRQDQLTSASRCPVNQNQMPPPPSLSDTRLQQQAAYYQSPPASKLQRQPPSSVFPSQREAPSAAQSPPTSCEPSRGPFHSQVVAISALRSTLSIE